MTDFQPNCNLLEFKTFLPESSVRIFFYNPNKMDD